MDKYARGESAALPFELQCHVIAMRYGLDPDVVAAWPVDKYLKALALAGASREVIRG